MFFQAGRADKLDACNLTCKLAPFDARLRVGRSLRHLSQDLQFEIKPKSSRRSQLAYGFELCSLGEFILFNDGSRERESMNE